MDDNGQIYGNYKVIYKHPRGDRVKTFVGKCENFTPVGKSAFSNDKHQLLLVDYNDIVQLIPLDEAQ